MKYTKHDAKERSVSVQLVRDVRKRNNEDCEA